MAPIGLGNRFQPTSIMRWDRDRGIFYGSYDYMIFLYHHHLYHHMIIDMVKYRMIYIYIIYIYYRIYGYDGDTMGISMTILDR